MAWFLFEYKRSKLIFNPPTLAVLRKRADGTEGTKSSHDKIH